MSYPPTLTGFARRFLQEGPHEDRLADIELRDAEVVRAIDVMTKEEIPASEISDCDAEWAREQLLDLFRTYGE